MSAKLVKQLEASCSNDSQSMLPSFLNKFPDNTECGEFLCLEVGGSTLRAALVRLYEAKGPAREPPEVLDMQSWCITKELKSSNGESFIRWIARTVAGMLKKRQVSMYGEDSSLKACLTWSFPFEQEAIDRGTILCCGKGFLVFDELVGCDIGALLHDAFINEGISICFKAIVNDTVAGLLAGNYADPSMRTFVTLGTGLNAATTVPVSRIGPHKLVKHPPAWFRASSSVLVNTELSLLGDTIFPRTMWDNALTQNIPSDVCFQPLEYLCSGYYLGEIVRIILVWAVRSGCLFAKHVPPQLLRPFTFDSILIAKLGSDSTQDLSISAIALIRHFRLLDHQAPTLRELRMIKAVAQSVSLRAAGYIAVAIHALSEFTQVARMVAEPSNQNSSNQAVVGVSGALFENLLHFKDSCENFLNEMAHDSDEVGGIANRFVLKHVPSGSMIGSALAAAAYQ
ncbi:Fc.00g072110.m01.CDS01 [Cosmosporella sp. VM-42]